MSWSRCPTLPQDPPTSPVGHRDQQHYVWCENSLFLDLTSYQYFVGITSTTPCWCDTFWFIFRFLATFCHTFIIPLLFYSNLKLTFSIIFPPYTARTHRTASSDSAYWTGLSLSCLTILVFLLSYFLLFFGFCGGILAFIASFRTHVPAAFVVTLYSRTYLIWRNVSSKMFHTRSLGGSTNKKLHRADHTIDGYVLYAVGLCYLEQWSSRVP